jgi:hypothetical protein
MAKSQVPADLGQPIPYDPDFNGPLKNRSCTDIICLLLFLIFIGCWAGIAIYGESRDSFEGQVFNRKNSVHQWGPVHFVGTARLGRQQMRFGPQREGQTLFVLL